MPFYQRNWFTISVRIIVAAVLGFVFAYYTVSTFVKPEFVVVATYGHVMPWDFILESCHPECQSAREVLPKIVSYWQDLGKAVGDDFPKKLFEMDSISRNYVNWGDPRQVGLDPVENAYRTLEVLHPEYLTDVSNLLQQLQASNSIPVTNRDYLVVAMTPDRSWNILTNRLNALSNALTRALGQLRATGGISFYGGVQTKFCRTYEEVVTNLANGKIDLAFCSPYSTFIAEHVTNKIDLLGRTKKTFKGESWQGFGYNVDLIVKATKMPLASIIADPRNHFTFVYSSEYSTSGYLIGLRMLDGLGILDRVNISSNALYNHDEVIKAISQSDSNYLASIPSDRTAEHRILEHAKLGAAIGISAGSVITLIILGTMSRLKVIPYSEDIRGIIVVAFSVGSFMAAWLLSSVDCKSGCLAAAIAVPGFYLSPFIRFAGGKSQYAFSDRKAWGIVTAEFAFACLPLLISFFQTGYSSGEPVDLSQWWVRFLSQPEISFVAAVLFAVSAYKGGSNRLVQIVSGLGIFVALLSIPLIWINETKLESPLIRLQLVLFFWGSVMFFGTGLNKRDG